RLPPACTARRISEPRHHHQDQRHARIPALAGGIIAAMSHAPADEYRARLSGRRAAHLTLTRSDERLSYARLAVFVAGAVVPVGGGGGGGRPAWGGAPAA